MSMLRFALLSSCAGSIAFVVACSGSSSGGTTNDGGDVASETGSCRAKGQHRPTAEECGSNDDAGVMETGCGGTFTPHDECTTDDQCTAAHSATDVCACQAPRGMGCGAGTVAGNVCVPANCHSDSECSACGECRQESGCGVITGYYCATPLDECSTNADCGSGFCTFKGDRWKCDTTVACAG
jgi:hypothetical protein